MTFADLGLLEQFGCLWACWWGSWVINCFWCIFEMRACPPTLYDQAEFIVMNPDLFIE